MGDTRNSNSKYYGRSDHQPIDLREWLGPDGDPVAPVTKLDLRKSPVRSERLFYETMPLAGVQRNVLGFNDQMRLPQLSLPNWLTRTRLHQTQIFGLTVFALPRRRFWYWLIAGLTALLMLLSAGALIMKPSIIGPGRGRGSFGLGGGSLPSGGGTGAALPSEPEVSPAGSGATATASPTSGSTPISSTIHTTSSPARGATDTVKNVTPPLPGL